MSVGRVVREDGLTVLVLAFGVRWRGAGVGTGRGMSLTTGISPVMGCGLEAGFFTMGFGGGLGRGGTSLVVDGGGGGGATEDLRLCRSIMLRAHSWRSTGVRFAA